MRLVDPLPKPLGLATGRTMEPVYSSLVARLKSWPANDLERLLQNWSSFNLDEYVGLEPQHPQSYHYFMWNNLFKHINIKKENVNILDGCANNLKEECDNFEKK